MHFMLNLFSIGFVSIKLPLSEVKKLGFDKFLLQKESNNIDNSLFDLRMYLTPFNVGQLMVGQHL